MIKRNHLPALLLALSAFTAACQPPEQESAVLPMAQVPAKNPGHFVPSDVARLAATGRPQLVEVFHYG